MSYPQRNISTIIGLAVFMVAGGTAWVQNSRTPVSAVSPTEVSRSTPPPSGTQPPGASVPADTGTTSYTMAQIATHQNASSCWTTINGGVYDVTGWISQHPGGAQAILSLCGTDGSAAFNAQHGGQRRPANELAGFKIGTLAP